MGQAVNNCEKMTQANYKIMADPYKMVPDDAEINLDRSITNLNHAGINLDRSITNLNRAGINLDH